MVCSFGGHLTELQSLSSAFDDHETFFVTYENFRTKELETRSYLLDPIHTDVRAMLKAIFQIGRIFVSERPDVVVSTGAEIAIPAFLWGTILGAETIFIESWCRVRTRSQTGRVVYPLSDLFLVQWPELLDSYGEKATYEGGVL
ncbi:PssD/Cps14F family polysaccharide biosynthesis glycosyltransferase [Haloarcula nitratireducens]|uniref:Uncharacterized protein n=1 Tax=Haloarcula nitratireducens TaxID=2487749 RepID=A0AAW4PJ38_9EURY|nr:PssD/Cps14F family polysaccharide biosynthesis glycosyltransferase [Halomicroarcula nitratireducens]MBX0297772.1 hypothetical protein [Halomicroarcula nitratireducens]